MSTLTTPQHAKRLTLHESMALKHKARQESPTRRFTLEVGLEMERTSAERWLARLLKKPDVDSLTDAQRAFVVEEIRGIIPRHKWCLLGSGEPPRVNGCEALNLYPRAILITRNIAIVGPKNMTLKDAPEVSPGSEEEYGGRYLASQGFEKSEYKFHTNLELEDLF